jgi:8-oxo-dGTP diphosphatase
MRRDNEMQLKQVYVHYQKKAHPADSFKYCPRCRTELTIQEIDHRLRLVCSGCGFIHFKNPFPVVSLLILRGDQMLLGKRAGDPGKGLWGTPSGYIEYEDDFLTTAIREAKEETGLDVEIKSILNVHSSFVSERFHFFGVYLLAEVVGGELAAGDDLESVAWFPLSGPFPDLAFIEDSELLETYSKSQLVGLGIDPNFARSE